jgi:hypothetical protein
MIFLDSNHFPRENHHAVFFVAFQLETICGSRATADREPLSGTRLDSPRG